MKIQNDQVVSLISDEAHDANHDFADAALRYEKWIYEDEGAPYPNYDTVVEEENEALRELGFPSLIECLCKPYAA